jgi:hypothetical protein
VAAAVWRGVRRTVGEGGWSGDHGTRAPEPGHSRVARGRGGREQVTGGPGPNLNRFKI